jgi:putative SOS response-associated peptidase YedK
MCGRYSFFIPLEQAENTLEARALYQSLGSKQSFEGLWQPRYNAAPTQYMPVITNEFPGVIQFFRWGLVPKWANEPSIGFKMINTRAESIIEKPAFRNIFKHKRCLVPANGYYEWQAAKPEETGTKSKTKAVKQPFRFHIPGDEMMLLAGLWDCWGPENLHTFSIITCPANQDTAPYHDRMPVILSHLEAKEWINNQESVDTLIHLLKPAPDGLLEIYPISTYVNKPGNEGEGVIQKMDI